MIKTVNCHYTPYLTWKESNPVNDIDKLERTKPLEAYRYECEGEICHIYYVFNKLLESQFVIITRIFDNDNAVSGSNFPSENIVFEGELVIRRGQSLKFWKILSDAITPKASQKFLKSRNLQPFFVRQNPLKPSLNINKDTLIAFHGDVVKIYRNGRFYERPYSPFFYAMRDYYIKEKWFFWETYDGEIYAINVQNSEAVLEYLLSAAATGADFALRGISLYCAANDYVLSESELKMILPSATHNVKYVLAFMRFVRETDADYAKVSPAVKINLDVFQKAISLFSESEDVKNVRRL